MFSKKGHLFFLSLITLAVSICILPESGHALRSSQGDPKSADPEDRCSAVVNTAKRDLKDVSYQITHSRFESALGNANKVLRCGSQLGFSSNEISQYLDELYQASRGMAHAPELPTKGKPIMIENKCHYPIKIGISYVDASGEIEEVDWTFISAKHNMLVTLKNGERIAQTEHDSFYAYAEVDMPGMRNNRLAGNSNVYRQSRGKSFQMRELGQVNDDYISTSLTCPDL